MDSVILVAVLVTGFVVWQVLRRPRPASKVEFVVRQAPQPAPQPPEQQYVIQYAPEPPKALEQAPEAVERPGSIYYTREGRHTR